MKKSINAPASNSCLKKATGLTKEASKIAVLPRNKELKVSCDFNVSPERSFVATKRDFKGPNSQAATGGEEKHQEIF